MKFISFIILFAFLFCLRLVAQTESVDVVETILTPIPDSTETTILFPIKGDEHFVVLLFKNAINDASSNMLFTGGILLGIWGFILYQLKAWPLAFWNWFVKMVSHEVYLDSTSDIYERFSEWYKIHYPAKFKRVQAEFESGGSYLDLEEEENTDNLARVQYTQSYDRNAFWHKGRLLFVQKEKEKLENANSIFNMHLEKYVIKGLFAKEAIEDIMNQVVEMENEIRMSDKRLYVYYNDANDGFYSMEWESVKTFDKLFFPRKEKLIADLEGFQKSEAKYKKLGINYKRGYFYSGEPGGGKTSIAVAMSLFLKRKLYIINLSTISDNIGLQRVISRVDKGSMVLFDDVDVNFGEGRKMNHKKIDFSTILGVLDGVYSPENIVFAMCTNHKEKLDPALIRTGRFDYVEHIDLPGDEEVRQFLNMYYETTLNGEAQGLGGIPMVDVQDACIKSGDWEGAVERIRLVRERRSLPPQTVGTGINSTKQKPHYIS